MASFYKSGRTYTVVFRLKGFPRQYIYGIKTKALARQCKHQKELSEQRAQAGLLAPDAQGDRMEMAARTPITAHVEAFEKDILARGRSPQHAQQQAAHCRKLFRVARISRIDELACEPLQRALRTLLGPKCGPRTCNAARQAVIQFERYLLRSNRIARAVLQDLCRFNEQLDVRRTRRPLTEEEVSWLLSTTERLHDTTSRRCGISPADRAVLYAVGIGTGFRRSALLSLEKASFHISQPERAFVRLAARFNKNGKGRDQLIRADLAGKLQTWLRGRPDQGPVWCPAPHADLALRFRRDLEAARKAWIADARDDGERERRTKSDTLKFRIHDGTKNVYADFHGLRHTGITFVVRRSGLRVGQAWADHSTPLLTARYAEVDRADLVTALEGLPAVGRR